MHALHKNFLPAFATPVCNSHWPDLADEAQALREVVLRQASCERGLSRSNVGGWHSKLDFLARDEPCVRLLRQRITALLTELNSNVLLAEFQADCSHFVLESWANVLRVGDYNVPHNHPNAFWSGVYFVNGNPKVDGREMSGKLELCDPRPGASLNYSAKTALYGRLLINPLPGQVVVFPAWLMHQVHPFFGEGERISVAFNAMLT